MLSVSISFPFLRLICCTGHSSYCFTESWEVAGLEQSSSPSPESVTVQSYPKICIRAIFPRRICIVSIMQTGYGLRRMTFGSSYIKACKPKRTAVKLVSGPGLTVEMRHPPHPLQHHLQPQTHSTTTPPLVVYGEVGVF